MHREHGPPGPAHVIVLHGGPGAPGDAGGLAHLLADPLRVLEPWQRGSEEAPQTVAQHVADLRAFVDEHVTGLPTLVGHSWGAALALEYAVTHPVRSLVLVCSGTFDLDARAAFKRDRDKPYVVDPLPDDPLDESTFDARANRETWDDELRLQAIGHHPAAFATITAPVLMVHGADDPHPGDLIRASLPIPQLVYHSLPHCSHYPWRERTARAPFAALVRDFIAK
jgi:pimeloyl-ACP methyl ester carboxylesterase